MKRPLAAALLFFTAGVAAGFLIEAAAFFCAAILLAAAAVRKKYGGYLWLFFMLAAALGFANTYLRSRDAELDGLAASGKTVAIHGNIRSVSRTKTNRVKAVVSVSVVACGGDVYEKKFKMQAIFDENIDVRPGSAVRLDGALVIPERARNPGGFDEFLYLSARKLQYKSFVALIDERPRADLSAAVSAVSEKISAVYDSVLPEREAGIIKSIILGDRSGLDDYTGELFRLAGIYHILAISGLHISIFALLLDFILRRILPRGPAGAVCISFLILYCVMTGMSPSTVRAVIMCGLLIAGGIFARSADTLTSAAAAALCLLMYEPYYLFDAGFLYSFGAVFSLCLLTEPLKRVFVKIFPRSKPRGISDAVCGSAAVFVGTQPVALNLSYYFLPYSVAVNVLILPTMVFLLISGFACGLAGLFSPDAAAFFAGSVYFTLRAYAAVCDFFIRLPAAAILVGRVGFVLTASYCAALLLFVKTYSSFDTEHVKYKKIFAASAAVFLTLFAASRFYPFKFTAAILDVGQGDAAVLMKNNAAFIIDGGGRPGSDVLTPYLDYSAVRRAEAAFVSHFDADHMNGIKDLVINKRVKAVFYSPQNERDASFAAFASLCEAYGVDLIPFSAGDSAAIGRGISVSCLHPAPDYDPYDLNDASLVLRVAYKDSSFLFTGDIGAAAESVLVNGGEIGADILKLAHHGSKYSSSEIFLERADPLVAVCGAGRNNPYGHPAAETLERLENYGISLYNTADRGAVVITTGGDGYRIRTMLE